MNPAASSFASSFLMASCLSGENRRNRCFFWYGFRVDLQGMLDQLLEHPWHICWFPREYISVGPKEVDELEFLFVAQASSDDSSFGVISLLYLISWMALSPC